MQGDHVADTLLAYAKNETYNATTGEALSKFAENFVTVQDYRNAQVHTTIAISCRDFNSLFLLLIHLQEFLCI